MKKSIFTYKKNEDYKKERNMTDVDCKCLTFFVKYLLLHVIYLIKNSSLTKKGLNFLQLVFLVLTGEAWGVTLVAKDFSTNLICSLML